MAFGLLTAACSAFGGLGADELPERLSGSERDKIGETLSLFFDGAAQYNPQFASDAMLMPGELGIEEFKRFVLQLSTFEIARIPIEFVRLGEGRILAEPAVARVVASTNIGNMELDLVRRDGRWRVASVPDFTLPASIATYEVTWEVTNSYHGPSGAFTVVGRVMNAATSPDLLNFGPSGYITDEEGRVITTGTSVVMTSAFLNSGAESLFQIDFVAGDRDAADPSRFELIPHYRPLSDTDTFVRVTTPRAEISPEEARGGLRILLKNSDTTDRQREADAQVIAVVRDGAGRPLSLYASPRITIPAGGSRSVDLPPADPLTLEGASTVTIEPWGVEPAFVG